MEMKDTLSGTLADVRHNPIARLGDAFPTRDLRRSQQKLGRQLGIGCRQLGYAGDVSSRDHEHVEWSLRLDVSKRQPAVSLGNDIRRDLATGDPAKQTILAHR
jgi:hypothetical protein